MASIESAQDDAVVEPVKDLAESADTQLRKSKTCGLGAMATYRIGLSAPLLHELQLAFTGLDSFQHLPERARRERGSE